MLGVISRRQQLLPFTKLVSCRLFSTEATHKTVHNKDEVFIEKLELEQHRGIYVLNLNRHSVKNALSKSFVKQWYRKLDELDEAENVRVVILRSLIPGVFCAGADLKERLSMKLNELEPFVNSLRSLTTRISDLPWPTIAAIDGAALGGGLEIALSCDLRIASTTAKLGLVETKLAIIPGAGGTQRLPRLIGPGLAKELIFTGRVIDGEQAKHYGIVNHSVKPNDTNDAAYLKALSLCEEMLPNGPKALKMAKSAINKGCQVDLDTGLKIEGYCYAQIIPTLDRIEGLQAFLEKRDPCYTDE